MTCRPILPLASICLTLATLTHAQEIPPAAFSEEVHAAVAAAPDNIDARTRLAEALQREGDFPGAIKQYEACVKLAPADNALLHALACLYERERCFTDAINTYKILAAQDPARTGGYYRKLLDLQMNRKDEVGAVATAQQLLEQAPDDAEVRASLAVVFLRFRQPEIALEHAHEAVRLAPGEARYHRQLADILIVREHFGEAVDVVRQLLANTEVGDVRLQALRVLWSLYIPQGRQEELIAEWTAQVQSAPDQLQACEELATLWESAGQPERGFEVIESALAAGANRRAVLLALQRHAEFAENFEKVVSVHEQRQTLGEPPDSGELEALARAQLALGNVEGARETWQQLQSISPADSLACLTRYGLLSKHVSKVEAMPLLEQAIALDGNNAAARLAYADVLYDCGRLPEAITQLQSILSMPPELPTRAVSAPIAPLEASSEDLVFRVWAMHLRYWPDDYGCDLARPSFGGGRYERMREAPRPLLFAKPRNTGENGRSLAEIRTKALTMLASLALKSGQEAELLRPYVDRLTEHPLDMPAKEDLLDLYQKTGRKEEALALAESLRTVRPEDEQLLRKLAGIYAAKIELDKAVSVLEDYVTQGDSQRLLLGRDLAQRYKEAGRNEERTRLLASLHGQAPEDMTVLRQLFDDAVAAKDWPQAEAVLAEMGKLPLLNFSMLQLDFAGIARLGEQTALAEKYYIACILDDSSSAGINASAEEVGIFVYDPYEMPKSTVRGSNLAMMGAELGLTSDKLMALEQLRTLYIDTTGYDRVVNEHIIAPTEALIAQPAPRPTFSLAIPKLRLALLLQDGELAQAKELLDRLRASGLNDAQLDNLDLYLLAANEQFEVLEQRYAELLPRYPRQNAEIRLAQAELALRRGDFDRAEQEAQAVLAEPAVQRKMFLFLSRVLRGKQPERVIRLCDAWLAALKPSPNTLSVVANLYADAGKVDRAEALLWRAWEEHSGGRMPLPSAITHPAGVRNTHADELFERLVQLAKEHNRLEPFFNELKARVAEHAETPAYRWFLIKALQLAERKSDAVTELQALLAASPEDNEARFELAKLLVDLKRFDEARAVYEELMRSQPQRTEELSKALTQFAERAPSPETLQLVQQAGRQSQDVEGLKQLAQTLARQEQHAEAAELYRKVLELQPGDNWVHFSLAISLMAAKKPEEAIDAIQTFMKNGNRDRQFGSSMLKEIVGLYTQAGRREEISAAPSGPVPYDANLAALLRVQIAVEDSRHDEALALLDTLQSPDCETTVTQYRLQIAEAREDWAGVITLLEQEFQRGNQVDVNLLAECYVKTGQMEKAVMCWVRNMERPGSYKFREVFKRLTAQGLFSEAEAFYRAVLARVASDAERRQQLNRALAEAYFETGQFKELFVEAVKENHIAALPGIRELALGAAREQAVIVERRYKDLLSALPGNVAVLRANAEICFENRDWEKAAALYLEVLEIEPANEQIRMKYVDMLRIFESPQNREELLWKWAAEAPTAPSTLALAQRLGTPRGGIVLKRFHDEFLAPLPQEQREEAVRQIAYPLARAGHRDIAVAALKAAFEGSPGPETFAPCLNLLLNTGDMEAAFALWSANPEHRRGIEVNNDLAQMLYARGELDALVEAFWQFSIITGTDRGSGKTREILRVSTALKSTEVLERLLARVEDENSGNLNTGLLAAALHLELGHAEEALARYDSILQANSNVWEAKEGRENALKALGRAPVTEKKRKVPVLDATRQRIDNLVFSKKMEEARSALAELAGESPETLDVPAESFNRTIGQLYLNTKEPDKALPFLEQLWQLMNDNASRGILARCYVALKRPDEGMTLWKEKKLPVRAKEFEGFAGELVQTGYYDQGIEVLESLWKEHAIRATQSLALAYWKTGRDYREVFKRAAEEDGDKGRKSYGYASFLVNNELVEDAMHTPNLQEDPQLISALVQSISQLPWEPMDSLRTELIALLDSVDPMPPDAAQTLAGMHTLAGETLLAADCHAKIFRSPVAEHVQRHNALVHIFAYGTKDQVASILPRALEEFADLTLRDRRALYWIAEHPDRNAVQAMIEKSPMMNDAQKKLYAAYFDFRRDPSEVAAVALLAVGADPSITEIDLKNAYTVLMENEREDKALQCMQFYIERCTSEEDRQAALAESVMLLIRQHEHANAAGNLVRLLPFDFDILQPLRNKIISGVPGVEVESFRTALHEQIRKAGSKRGVEHLVTLSVELAARQGELQPIQALCDELGLEPYVADSAALWSGLIEQWLATGPENLEMGHDRMGGKLPGVLEAALQPGAPLPHAFDGWKSVDPAALYGLLDVEDILDARDHASKSVAYFVTEIESPDERQVTFTHGSDDWICIRLNGEVIHENYLGRECRVDQVRFEGQLKAGLNRILVKTGNENLKWEFALGIVKGGDGLKVVLPEVAAAATAQ